MAKIRVQSLAKELKVDVVQLLQRLKEDFGLQVTYLSTLDDEVAAQVRQLLSQPVVQVEERRIGENVKRRRRVAPVTPVHPAGPKEVSPIVSLPPTAEKVTPSRKPEEVKPRMVAMPLKKEPPMPAAPEKVMAQPETPPPSFKAEVPTGEPTLVTEAVRSETPTAEVQAAPTEVGPSPAAGAVVSKRPKSKAKRKETPARIISMPSEIPEVRPERASLSPSVTSVAVAPKEARVVSPVPPVYVSPAAPKPTVPPKPEIKPKKKAKKAEVMELPAKGKPVKRREVRERAELYAEGEIRLPGRRKGLKKAIKKVGKAELTVPKAIKRRIKVGESITVGELAKRMGIKSSEVIKKLLSMGVLAHINYPINYDSAVIVASEFGYEVERAGVLEEDLLAVAQGEEGEALPRPPVVTIMGHVDHGKTSLLDAIRESRIVAGEAGGITQHIGAYHVELPQGDVVFLDTPGHEAFTAMRARGAQVTDLVVLVVAADDGVMEQTQEAINHARAAGVPLVVAINKIDKPNANPDRVKRELANLGVVPEDWGGDVLFAEVSAKKRLGIDDLLDKILLQAEILDLKAPVQALAQGRIIEARLDKGRGPVGTVLVQKGTLKVGDYFVCGPQYGRVRALFDDRGNRIEAVTPGLPAEVQGFSGVPEAGDEFQVLEDERKVKQIAMMRQQKQREAALARLSKVSLERLYQQIKEGAVKELKVILKADVQGSIEALTKALSELGNEEIKVNLIHTGIGEVRESDIMLASASDAIVVGFNVRINPKAQALAEQEQVDVRFYDVIYALLNEIQAAMEGMLEPVVEERFLGQAEVRAVFTISKVGQVAGCMVQEGKVERGALARVKRGGETLVEGVKINSLKRFKEDVKEVSAGYECGIGLDRFSDFMPGDLIEVYVQEKVKAELAAPAAAREPMEG
uniref:Translation initiation factor IF-2 n=1 Tax=Desulfobacca acetoxidans TaxID=60893 RepID=A0A7C5EMG3_9BACT